MTAPMDPLDDTPSDAAPPVENLDRKARTLLVGVALLIAACALYVLYARGAFEREQTLVLIADNSEGVVVGMDLTFAGFPIGRVSRIELGADGNARIVVGVPVKDAHWLRTTSVFTMEGSLVGSTKLRAFSGVLSDPPLPDGAERKVLAGDAAAEIPKLIASVRDLVANLTTLTDKDGALSVTLRNVQTTTEAINGPRGALGVLFGEDKETAKKLGTTLDRANALLTRLDGLVRRADGIAAKADAQVFGSPGLVGESRAAVVQLDGLLADTRASLKKVDALLQEAQGIASNTREATSDLGSLRGEVEANLRKIEGLVNEINRKWPFARDTEIKLP
jgi:phospholipid/cholesterol/gamma-HCH transport system substrate-binding protein